MMDRFITRTSRRSTAATLPADKEKAPMTAAPPRPSEARTGKSKGCPTRNDEDPPMESNDRAAKRRRTTDEGPPQHLPIDPDPGRSEARHLDSLQTHQPKVPSPTPLEHAVAPPLGAEERALDPATAPGSTVYYSSSVYVDAFNLALDTMLEDEAHLFSWRERGVFACWRGLEYEAQHLYVRLFLRKTAAWHRVQKLGYHRDIRDMGAAVECLQESRRFWGDEGPPAAAGETTNTTPADETGDPGSHTDDSSDDFGDADTFDFADGSARSLTDLSDAAALLSLDELRAFAKDVKVPPGGRRADIIRGICRMGEGQASLMGVGVTRGRRARVAAADVGQTPPPALTKTESNRTRHFFAKIMDVLGPCVRLTAVTLALFERVHLVFYRSREWTEKSLTTIILAKTAKRAYYPYLVCRTANVFPSRARLLEYEAALKLEAEVDAILDAGPAAGGGGGGPCGPAGFRAIVGLFDAVRARWQALVREDTAHGDGCERPYLRRFSAGHPYTRVAHKAAYVLGRLGEHAAEHALLAELLAQRPFHPARRGGWYARKALLEENYACGVEGGEDKADSAPAKMPKTAKAAAERCRRAGRELAARTCEAGLQDTASHVIFHHDLQKRLVRLERRLGVPPRLRHEFGHVRLRTPAEHVVEGVQVVRAGPRPPGASTRTLWLDEHAPVETNREGSSNAADAAVAVVGVEDMCLSWYRARGWRGHHAEGGIVRTLFALLFLDVLFVAVPDVFQTAFQTCPLDLHTDAFYAARASEINRRLAEISASFGEEEGKEGGHGRGVDSGDAEEILRAAYAREAPRRTAVVGLDWGYPLEDLVGLARGLGGPALAVVCRVIAQEYRHRGGGMPDLVLWRGGQSEGGRGSGSSIEPGADTGASLDDDAASTAPALPAAQTTGSLDSVAPKTPPLPPPPPAKEKPVAMFVEVKSRGDRLSDTQRLWIDVLAGAGIAVAVCRAVARDVREVRSEGSAMRAFLYGAEET